MIVMHSLFDLEEHCSATDFQYFLKDFTEHLLDQDLLVSSRFMQRQAHEGYNATAPQVPYYLAIEFSDMTQAQACWEYMESDIEPIKNLHTKITSSICNSSFFLCSDIV